MDRYTKTIMLLVTSGIFLAGCSVTDVLTKFAASDVEMGAQEAYNEGKIIEAKKKTIELKKADFSEIAELKNVSESASIAYAFRKIENGKTQVDVEALLPNPGREVYEAWLKGSDNVKLDLGSFTFNNTDDYSLTFTTDKNISDKQTIIISRERVFDTKPDVIVMTGTFASASASPLTTSTH